MTTEAEKRYLAFEWSDQRWQSYYQGLYPPPDHTKIEFFKKKWFQKNIDASFDRDFDPNKSSQDRDRDSAAGAPPSYASAHAGQSSSPKTISSLGVSIQILGLAFALAGFLPFVSRRLAVFSLWSYVIGFALTLFADKGTPRLNAAYWQQAILDYNAQAIMVVLVSSNLLRPVASLCAASPALAAVINVAEAIPLMTFPKPVKALIDHPQFLKRIQWANKNRYYLMQLRANVELLAGLCAIVLTIMGRFSIVSLFIFWHIIYLLHKVNPFTQAAFRNLHEILMKSIFGQPWCPQRVANGYLKIREVLTTWTTSQ